MKRSLLSITLITIASFSICSCSSEYAEQFKKAKELADHYEARFKCCNEQEKKFLKAELVHINETFNFHATLSGNPTHFMKQLNFHPKFN